MEWSVFIKGLVIGVVMCAPVGPIGLLCLRRAVVYSRTAGFASVLGASTADGLYCAIAGLGISVVSNFLEKEAVGIQVCGAFVLVALGIGIYLSRPVDPGGQQRVKGPFSAYMSAFLLMLANPLPILVFTAAFAALGTPGWKGLAATATLVLGVFSGSALWGPALVGIVTLCKPRLDTNRLRLVNKTSGVIVTGLGVAACIATVLLYCR
ncbi:MAG: LysE family transporter [Thermodesulfobacteriota bacterium]